MKTDDVIIHQWFWPNAPAMWPVVVGYLRGYGNSRRKMLFNELIPHMVISGRGTFISNGKKTSVKAGDLFTIWPGIPYEFYEDPDAPWEFYWFHVRTGDMKAFGRCCGFSPHQLVITPKRRGKIQEALKALFEYYGQPPDLRDPFRALAIFCQFVAELRSNVDSVENEKVELNPNKIRSEKLVKEAADIIDTMMDKGINVNELARRLNVSRNTLLLAFRDKLEKTPQEYMTQIRLERANELLLRTNWTLGAIAEACGFRGEKYFMRVFKKRRGLTPTAWRLSR